MAVDSRNLTALRHVTRIHCVRPPTIHQSVDRWQVEQAFGLWPFLFAESDRLARGIQGHHR
jgi:hypothetical protein